MGHVEHPARVDCGGKGVLESRRLPYIPDATLRVVDTVEDTSGTGDTTRAVEKRERRQALQVAVKRLPEREHLVLSLYYYEGLTFKRSARSSRSPSRACSSSTSR